MAAALDGNYRVLLFYQENPRDPVTIRRDVTAAEAMLVFMAYVQAAKSALGTLARVVITNSPDDADMVVNFDWRYKQGVVYPNDEQLKKVIDG